MDSFAQFALGGGVFTLTNFGRLVALLITYHVVRALYNISPLHPLSHIPGPKLAAATWWYEGWFDLILGGRYTHEIRRMHEVYGPVVRINPEELHCNDASFVNEIYAGKGRKRNKQRHFLNSMAHPIYLSGFGTEEHEHHRLRRSAVNKFFSRAQIWRLESGIKSLVDQLCDKMIRLGNKDKLPINVSVAYSCFTSDVISGYCFGEPFGFVAQESWEPNFKESLNSFASMTFVFRFFPFLKKVAELAPFVVSLLFKESAPLMVEIGERMPSHIRKVREDFNNGIVKDAPSIFSSILGSSLPESEKTDTRLTGEGILMMSAGTETTSWTLTVTTYYLMQQPEQLARLRKELEDVDAGNMKWASLEKLPYLTAVINEGLRLAYGLPSRLPRIAPEETLVYRGKFHGNEVEYVLPPGTPVGMSNVINHHNEEAFPDSNKFRPERWLDLEDTERRFMDMCLTSFSKGSRQCLAMNLAYCNLYLAVTALALRILPRAKLHESTNINNVTYDHDAIIPVPIDHDGGVKLVLS
ncbi:hypothetical protein M426DRAFT_268132 [Hypoxylon sp. CI-4A]|nr:hypothetical protein M426DRAFT_268132 [Hypoxylon sp. CI-4A]